MFRHCCKGSSNYKPVTHVIFDLDGTILDSEAIYLKAIKQAVEKYGGVFFDDFIFQIKGSVEKDVGRNAIGTFGLDTTVEDFLKTYRGFSDVLLKDVGLMPGAERIIRHLHANKIPIAVATSSPQDSYELKTAKYQELFQLFHHIVCGGTDPEVENGKPAPDIFLIAASRFDGSPNPSECLVFEDSFNGLKAGLAAGMQVVFLPDPDVGYDIWKMATLRLDSFEYIVPQTFDLPPFPEGQLSRPFAELKSKFDDPADLYLLKEKDNAKKKSSVAMEIQNEESSNDDVKAVQNKESFNKDVTAVQNEDYSNKDGKKRFYSKLKKKILD